MRTKKIAAYQPIPYESTQCSAVIENPCLPFGDGMQHKVKSVVSVKDNRNTTPLVTHTSK
jgi:hypothetical protein